jgi:hypothetical protein
MENRNFVHGSDLESARAKNKVSRCICMQSMKHPITAGQKAAMHSLAMVPRVHAPPAALPQSTTTHAGTLQRESRIALDLQTDTHVVCTCHDNKNAHSPAFPRKIAKEQAL